MSNTRLHTKYPSSAGNRQNLEKHLPNVNAAEHLESTVVLHVKLLNSFNARNQKKKNQIGS
jgi:hypothetical protein